MTPPPGTQNLPQRRPPSERQAYVEGFKAGAMAAIREARLVGISSYDADHALMRIAVIHSNLEATGVSARPPSREEAP